MAELHSIHGGSNATSIFPIWRAIRWTEAGQVLALAEMAPANEEPIIMPPHVYAGALTEAGLLDDALAFTIHALPALQAVNLACRCAREVGNVESKFVSALEAAEAWVANPSDKRRRLAFDVAEKVGFKSAASFAALAAFWSGGSIAPEGGHPIPAPRGLCGKAACATAKLSIGAGGHIEGPRRLHRYLHWAKVMAEGGEVGAS